MKPFILSFFFSCVALAGDFQALCSDRLAIEAVYHEQRIGAKAPVEEILKEEAIQHLVAFDLRKYAALRLVYGVEVTPAMMEAEERRIDSTTRAPDTLAAIKTALGNDSNRFAKSFIRPIIVERELHRNFVFDDSVHAAKRKEAEEARERLLRGSVIESMHETTWQLMPPREMDTMSSPEAPTLPVQANGKSKSYTVEATIQRAQVLGAPTPVAGGDLLFYFADLHPELQKVLTVQLQQAGDVSAVIEGQGVFLVYQAKEKTAATLTVRTLSIPKLDYDLWLADLEL